MRKTYTKYVKYRHRFRPAKITTRTDRPTDIQRHIQVDKETHRQVDRHTHKQTDVREGSTL